MIRERLVVLTGENDQSANLCNISKLCFYYDRYLQAVNAGFDDTSFPVDYQKNTIFIEAYGGVLNSAWNEYRHRMLMMLMDVYIKHPITFARSKKSGNYLKIFCT